ncbi:oxidoreductase [Spongiactinospora sp. TRM90649]|uniref:oxidoreductase n=1 Tax=Spongiactinospora sp. TRM90649 TaxID=3031114 RepID=UPI0023F628E8|nr:oxidoreductase [Spongiactinospora sp. TRM90649]MDF5756954.1 oxidoreductase [Spongiactinospora sp. TRM90649]
MRIWLITGTSTGLGRALAEAVIDSGDALVATAREASTVKDLAERAPERVLALPLDVTDPGSVRAAVSAAVTAFGRIDVLVNNAGYGLRGAIEEATEQELRDQFETNVFGVLTVTRAVLPVMRRHRSGHIVQISSVGGVMAMLGGAMYAGTKFALEGLSEGLAAEVAHLGIKVTIVEPGPFRTDFAGRSIRWTGPMEDYAAVMEPARSAFGALDGTQPGDPARAAGAVIDVTRMMNPPLRLPLGAEAFTRIRDRFESRLRELDATEPIGLHTAFDDD